MNSLQAITDAWGNWYSRNNGTSCQFTASTNYGSHSELNSYHQYQASAAVQGIVYDGNNPPVNDASVAYELWYDNGTSLEQQNTFQETKSTTKSFTWSLTETLSVGVELSATESIPDVASISEKVTINLSLSSTQSQTVSNTQTWEVNTPINVPAYSSVKADMVISTQSYNVNFTESVLLQGYVAIWNVNKVNGHWLWFYPIDSVFQDCINNNLIDTSGYSVVSGGVMAQVTGVFTGSQGISVGVSANQYPLRNSLSSANAMAAVAGSHLLAVAGE